MTLAAPFSADHAADPFGDWPQWRKEMGLGPHRGKDFNRLAAGTPIPASGTGVAVGSGWSNALGWWVVVRYEVDDRYVYLGYCHLQAETHLSYGDWVALGDQVGLLGNTGTASDGDHLHLTASWQNGNPGQVAVIDPMQFFTGSAPAGGNTTEIGDDMPLTQAEWDRIDLANKGANDNLLKQIAGVVWGADLTHKSGIHGTAQTWLLNSSDMIGAILAKPSAAIDPAKLAAELKKAGFKIEIDSAALVKALDASLRDDFAGVGKSVLDEAAARLKS